MAMQQVEFDFPDPDKVTTTSIEVEQDVDDPRLEIEGAVGRETVGKKKKNLKVDDVEIEIVDDVPPGDRNRKPSAPPEGVTDEELENYSDKVKKRIQHFSKGYHDERRAKEQALREREELERYARVLVEENQKLKGSVDKGHNALIESAKKQVLAEVQAAKQKYKEAYEAGGTDAIIAAQESLNSAQIRMDKVNNLAPRAQPPEARTLQNTNDTVQQQQKPPAPAPSIPRDVKAEAWRNDNSWFGSDDEMTASALGYHSKLVKEGVDPTSDEYYEKVNSRMRKLFPENFDDDIEDATEPRVVKKAANVVAPATRSTAPIKVRLSDTQVALAKKLGVPLADYAKQVALLRRS
jgi:hypothetical protein